MGKLKEYNIHFGKLEPGNHSFEYKVDGEFFAHYEDSLISNCKTIVQLKLQKVSSVLLNLTFSIKGTIDQECDRCLEELAYPIETNYKIIVKLENQEDNDNDEILYLSPDAYEINISDLLYDFHILSIPFKKECLEVSDKCDEIDNYINSNNTINESEEEDIDPRWNDLKKLLS